MWGVRVGDEAAGAGGRQREHENKSAFFHTLADNLIPGETYRLSEQNCMRIELYAQYF